MHAARARAPFERATLLRLADVARTSSGTPRRATPSSTCSRAGAGAIPVFEALDHVGVLVRLLPEWEHVRARPQRNAYHRFTVDRHLLEAVAECAALLDPDDAAGDGFDGVAAAPRAASCCCSARCSTTSARAARRPLGRRRGDRARASRRASASTPHGADDLAWLVRNHLLLADTATRRDLGDERTIARYADEVPRRRTRNALLYALTIGDSRATGPRRGARPRPRWSATCSSRPTPDSVPTRSSTTGPIRATRSAR